MTDEQIKEIILNRLPEECAVRLVSYIGSYCQYHYHDQDLTLYCSLINAFRWDSVSNDIYTKSNFLIRLRSFMENTNTFYRDDND